MVRAPRSVVALGGGTGLPAVLRGLRRMVVTGRLGALTAVVAVTDDGGSSGRLRSTRGVPPPGDIRNCLVALSPEEDLLAGLFQYRYQGTAELGGHTVGNLILAALAEQTGSFLKAVEVSGLVLRTAGRILPATLEDVVLTAVFDDGSLGEGESRIGCSGKRIRRVGLDPPSVKPCPGVVEAIQGADLIVLGPGSLFTSVVPHLAVSSIAAALRNTRAVRVFVSNLVSEKGETNGLDLVEHVRVIESHAGGQIVDAVLAHEGPIAADVRQRYAEEGASPLVWPDHGYRDVVAVRTNLLEAGPKLRHDPDATARGLMEAWETIRGSAAQTTLHHAGRGR